MPFCGAGSYCPIWTHDWSPDTLQRYFAYQGVSVIPTGNGWSSCKMPEQAHCKLATLSRSVVSSAWHSLESVAVADGHREYQPGDLGTGAHFAAAETGCRL